MATKNQPENNKGISNIADREIAISRMLNAPRELVWKVWTEPEHIAKWWGPNGFTNTIKEMDVRPDGMWLHTMHGPDGTDYPNKAVYKEVVKPERIVYVHSAPGFTATVTFEAVYNKTKLTMSMVFDSIEVKDLVVKAHGAIEGQVQTINRLEEYLSGMQVGEELVISRTFNAPKELVYKAFSQGGAIAQWWGPKGCTLNIKTFDFSPGGVFHYNMEFGGRVMWGIFKYLEMVAPDRIVFINSFSDEDGNVTANAFIPNFPMETLNIVTFVEHEGKTTLTFRGGAVNATEEQQKVYDGMKGGLQQGFAGTFDQLEQYLATSK